MRRQAPTSRRQGRSRGRSSGTPHEIAHRAPVITRDAFNALWIGQTVSALGTQVSMVALPLIAVLTLHVGPLELGILAALETVPYLVLVPARRRARRPGRPSADDDRLRHRPGRRAPRSRPRR